MNRAASATLIVGGVALLATRLVSPASSASAPTHADGAGQPEQAARASTAVSEEVDRLRDRLAAQVEYPAPARDPFHFGGRQSPPSSGQQPDAAVEPAVPPIDPPRLVAIMSSTTGPVVHTAVFAVADGVEFLRLGYVVRNFRLEAVETDRVTLVERDTGRSVDLSLH